MRLSGHVACVGDRRDAYRVLVGRPDGKRPLGGPGWKYYIKMYLKKKWVGKPCTGIFQLRWLALVNAVMNLWVS